MIRRGIPIPIVLMMPPGGQKNAPESLIPLQLSHSNKTHFPPVRSNPNSPQIPKIGLATEMRKKQRSQMTATMNSIVLVTNLIILSSLLLQNYLFRKIWRFGFHIFQAMQAAVAANVLKSTYAKEIMSWWKSVKSTFDFSPIRSLNKAMNLQKKKISISINQSAICLEQV